MLTFAGLCSCSSIQPSPGQLVVTKAECCRGEEEEVESTFSSLRSNSTRVLCPPHLPREYRCNSLKMSLPTYPPLSNVFPRFRNQGKGSLSCPSYSSPSKCVCFSTRPLGFEGLQRYRGRIEGSSCTCPETPESEVLTNWPIIRLTCCVKHSNEDVKVEHKYWDRDYDD